MFIDPSSLASDREDAVPYTPQRLPSAPPAALPSPPPAARPVRPHVNMFDKEHRRDTLFALGTGLLSGGNDFSASLAGAARNLSEARQGYLAQMAPPKHELGGPDNSFDIITDPRTGQRTIQPIPQFQQYLADKEAAAAKAKNVMKPQDAVALRGSVTGAIMRLPPDQRHAAYDQLRKDTVAVAGSDLGLPPTWDDHMGQVYTDAAVDPEHRLTADTAASRLSFEQSKFAKEFPLKQANTSSEISTRGARLGLAAAAGARAAAKAALPKAPPGARGRTAALPSGFKLD